MVPLPSSNLQHRPDTQDRKLSGGPRGGESRKAGRVEQKIVRGCNVKVSGRHLVVRGGNADGREQERRQMA